MEERDGKNDRGGPGRKTEGEIGGMRVSKLETEKDRRRDRKTDRERNERERE